MTSSLNQGDDNPEEEEENFAVAIDLGTTYCCVGIWRDDKVEIVADEFGNRKTPCFVSFTDTETLIGEAAKDQLLVNPSNTLFDVMRLIGRRYSDAQVQEDIKLWPFIVTAGPDDKPVIGVNSQGQEKQFTAEEVLAMLLRKMVDIAAAFLGKPIQTAVVTIPAADFFTDHSRDAVKSAAKIAGFEIMRLVKEPIAAGVAYMSVEDAEILASSDVKTILVFNFGGRSLDIAVMTIDEVRIYDIMAQSTDLNLGGHNLDNRLMQHFAREIEMKFQENIFADSEALFSFRSVCEGLKRKLSSSSEATAEMSWKGFDIQMTITRDKFEEISMDLLNECVVQVERCLKTARTDKMKLDKVILVGGSSRIPKVQTLLQDFFCGKELCDAFNPDEVVAYGAAVTAWRIMNTVEQVDLLCGPDILPLNLGLETADGAMAVVISRNTYILPATRTEVFSTYTDYQKSVVLQIYEGQSIRAKDNHFIGTLELPGIVQSPQGSPQVEVTFKVDEDGLLTIVAEEKVAGVRKEITFGPSFTWSHSVFSGRLTWEQEVKLVEEGEEQRKGFADDSNYGTPSNKLLRG